MVSARSRSVSFFLLSWDASSALWLKELDELSEQE